MLFRIIDAMMALPEALEPAFEEAVQQTRKFGTLPDWAKVRLVAADDVTLQHWAEQILDAGCIEDVFK